MRRIFNAFLTLVTSMLFASCDPTYTTDFAIDNTTKYDLVVISLDTNCSFYKNTPNGYPVSANSKEILYLEGGLGTASMESAIECVKRNIYGDSVMFTFSNGLEKKYTSADTLEGPYNFGSTDYSWYQISENLGYYGCLTYKVKLEE